MKKLVLISAIILVTAGLYAQDSFFASKPGMELLYANNNAKGKTTGYTQLVIRDVQGSGKNMTITYGSQSLDSKRMPPSDSPEEMTLKVIVTDGVVRMDLNQAIPAELRQQGTNIEISGDPMELPDNLQPGQTLKDSSVTMTVDMVITKLTTVINMTDGKCLAIEDITVPAGTFTCSKVTQTVTSTIMKKTNSGTTISWYAPNIGTVKTETYDSKGKPVSSMVLVELKGN